MIAEERNRHVNQENITILRFPKVSKLEVGNYALNKKAALEKFGKKYPKYTFDRTSVNNWKKTISDGKDVHRKNGRPNLLIDELLLSKVKDVITGTRLARSNFKKNGNFNGNRSCKDLSRTFEILRR